MLTAHWRTDTATRIILLDQNYYYLRYYGKMEATLESATSSVHYCDNPMQILGVGPESTEVRTRPPRSDDGGAGAWPEHPGRRQVKL